MITFEKNSKELSLPNILKSIENVLNIHAENIFISNRERDIVNKRQIFYFLAKTLTKKSLYKIAEFTEQYYYFSQHHATILWAIKQVNDLSITDKKIRRDVDLIKHDLNMKFGIMWLVKDVDLLNICIQNTKNTYKNAS